jgi:hypothetical protein
MHKNFYPLLNRAGSLAVVIILTSGCSSIIDARKQKKPYIDDYYSGSVTRVAAELSEKSDGRADTGDELMWLLEAGTANYTAEQYQRSLQLFEKSESLIQEFDARAVVNARGIGAEIGSTITNANALPYRGMYLDRIMLNAYKALNYFAINDTSGAHVELRRMREEQQQVVRQFDDELRASEQEIQEYNLQNQQKSRSLGNKNTTVPFSTIINNPVVNEAYTVSEAKSNKLYGSLGNPFVSYLSAMGYLMENNYGEALVDFRNLYKMIPNNKLIQRDYVTVAKQIGSEIPVEIELVEPFSYPLNSKIVYVVLFNGRAPALKQEKFQLILPYVGYTGIAFPRYEYFPLYLQGLDIAYKLNNQQESVKTEQIANFDAIMSQEYHNKLPTMVTRLVVSTLAKELASYAIVQAAHQSNNGAELGALVLTGMFKYLFNTADTRGWETLPKEVQVTHFPIPDGGRLRISPVNMAGNAVQGNYSQGTEIVLNKETNIAIVYVRALSEEKLIYKVIELQ